MVKPKVLKCKDCGKEIDTTIDHLHDENSKGEKLKKPYWLCNECFQLKTQKKDDWSELFEYIKKMYRIDTLTGLMFKQIKEFREQYGYKDTGILLTLRYCFEVLDMPIKDDTALGIVPYYYERAKSHYLNTKLVERSVCNLDGEWIGDEVVNLTIVKPNDDGFLKYKEIDISEL